MSQIGILNNRDTLIVFVAWWESVSLLLTCKIGYDFSAQRRTQQKFEHKINEFNMNVKEGENKSKTIRPWDRKPNSKNILLSNEEISLFEKITKS